MVTLFVLLPPSLQSAPMGVMLVLFVPDNVVSVKEKLLAPALVTDVLLIFVAVLKFVRIPSVPVFRIVTLFAVSVAGKQKKGGTHTPVALIPTAPIFSNVVLVTVRPKPEIPIPVVFETELFVIVLFRKALMPLPVTVSTVRLLTFINVAVAALTVVPVIKLSEIMSVVPFAKMPFAPPFILRLCAFKIVPASA